MVEEEELKIVDKRGQGKEPDKLMSSEKIDLSKSEAKTSEDATPVDFASFTVGLATQAMMLLGEIPEPQTGKLLQVNLNGARQLIDIISLLQEKTKGNLTQDEEKLLQDIITSLRIEFVKKAKK